MKIIISVQYGHQNDCTMVWKEGQFYPLLFGFKKARYTQNGA